MNENESAAISRSAAVSRASGSGLEYVVHDIQLPGTTLAVTVGREKSKTRSRRKIEPRGSCPSSVSFCASASGAKPYP